MEPLGIASPLIHVLMLQRKPVAARRLESCYPVGGNASVEPTDHISAKPRTPNPQRIITRNKSTGASWDVPFFCGVFVVNKHPPQKKDTPRKPHLLKSNSPKQSPTG